jgi:diadenosine tetraphosphatase ApaH/serine/threonine PP2A family protein phosphatase
MSRILRKRQKLLTQSLEISIKISWNSTSRILQRHPKFRLKQLEIRRPGSTKSIRNLPIQLLAAKFHHQFLDSDFPSKCPIGGSLTRLDYHAALDDVWNRTTRGEPFLHRDSNVSTNTSGSSNEFAIEKVPPRRHRLTEVQSMFLMNFVF